MMTTRGSGNSAVPLDAVTELTKLLECTPQAASSFYCAVDPAFYQFTYGPVALDPAVHYARFGWTEDFDPNPWFSTHAYASKHRTRRETVPLFDYLQHGANGARVVEVSAHAANYHGRAARESSVAVTLRKYAAQLTTCSPRDLSMQIAAVRTYFDSAHYLSANPGIAEAAIDALLHFLIQGWREFRDPNPWFSISAYLDANPDVAAAGINPFYHYVRYGLPEGRAHNTRAKFDAQYYAATNPDVVRQGYDPLTHFITKGWREQRAPNAVSRRYLAAGEIAPQSVEYSNYEYVLDSLSKMGRISIVIPICNAADEVDACLQSIRRNSTYPSDLILVDDGSTDPRIQQLLEAAQAGPHTHVLRNQRSEGFAAAVNRGLRASDGHVVVLNSDTSVGPRWLESLLFAASQRPTIGTVTAVSNNAGAFTVVPDGVRLRGLPYDTRDAISRIAMQRAGRTIPATPTANGFCMFMRREMIEQVGLFDSHTFSRGYGEENDYCMRALKCGWEHIIADDTFVFHAGSASFGLADREKLTEEGMRAVNRLHPEYDGYVRRFLESPPLAAIKKAGGDLPIDAIIAGQLRVRPRALHVVHGDALGGVMEFCLDLASGMHESVEPYILSSSGTELRLYTIEGRNLKIKETIALANRVALAEARNPDYRKAIYTVFERYRFELVHVHHIMHHSLDLLDIARRLNIPSIVTIHDYYLACPSYNLLDDELKFCDGVCTAGPGKCDRGNAWISEGPPLKHRWVHEWRERVADALDAVSTFVVPSHDAKERVIRLLPSLASKDMLVIEPGVNMPRVRAASAPEPGEKVRVLFPGYLAPHKGQNVIDRLHQIDGGRRLEFHFLGGTLTPTSYGVQHGTYKREDFTEKVLAIRPTIIAILSIWPETYCYVLSEAWYAGVPVIGSSLGAVGERLKISGAGWVSDVSDTAMLYERILNIADDKAEYARAVRAVNGVHLRSVGSMCAEYLELYTAALQPQPCGGR